MLNMKLYLKKKKKIFIDRAISSKFWILWVIKTVDTMPMKKIVIFQIPAKNKNVSF